MFARLHDCVLILWCGMIDTCTDLCGCTGVLDCFVNSDVCMHAQRDTCTFMSYYADVLDSVVTHWCVKTLPKIFTLSCVALLVYWCVHAFMTWSIFALSCVDVWCARSRRDTLMCACMNMDTCTVMCGYAGVLDCGVPHGYMRACVIWHQHYGFSVVICGYSFMCACMPDWHSDCHVWIYWCTA